MNSYMKLMDDIINQCAAVIKSNDNDNAEKLEKTIITIYQSLIPNISNGLEAYANGGDYVADIVKLKVKLDFYKANKFNSKDKSKVDIKAELSKVREEVEVNEILDDDAKAEIEEKLKEIEDIIDENLSNNDRWKKLKDVIIWTTTKGYKIGEMVLSIISKVASPRQ